MNKNKLYMALAICAPVLLTVACGNHHAREQISDESSESKILDIEETHIEPVSEAQLNEVVNEKEEMIEVVDVEMVSANIVSEIANISEADKPSESVLYFNTNEAIVKQEFLGMVLTHAEYMAQNPEARLKLVGYTDQSGNSDYNKALAKRRTDAVAKLLIEFGVQVDQIMTEGVGEIVTGSELEHVVADRRVEFEYLEQAQLSEL